MTSKYPKSEEAKDRYLYVLLRTTGFTEGHLFGLIPLSANMVRAALKGREIVNSASKNAASPASVTLDAASYAGGALCPTAYGPMYGDDNLQVPCSDLGVQLLECSAIPENEQTPPQTTEMSVTFYAFGMELSAYHADEESKWIGSLVPYSWFESLRAIGINSIETTQHTWVKENDK